MNNVIKAGFIFIAGIGVGAIATNLYFKTKYETIAQEEIDSVKEVWEKKKHSGKYPWGEGATPVEKPAISEYVKQITPYTESKVEETEEASTPYVISDTEFGELENYETVSLIYYNDDVLATDDDEVLDDPSRYVGTWHEDYFSDPDAEDDAIYIRNDKLKIDYEILRSDKDFIEMKVPGPTED